jgi:adenosylcobinamide kinase/adenosylcobinamide-phosphate guanylyltransferase
MSDIVVITGGVRSGKSRYALQLAAAHDPKTFIATATASDDEMRARIDAHRAERAASWTTIEEPLQLASVMPAEGVVVIDCMTLWLANAIDAGIDIDAALASTLAAIRAPLTIFVTNEVGWGIVPLYESARRYRDLAGAMNQRLAAAATQVVLMVAGLPLRVK